MPEEWPEDLRIREFPQANQEAKQAAEKTEAEIEAFRRLEDQWDDKDLIYGES